MCIRLLCAAFLCACAGLSCAAHRSPEPPLTAADGGPTLCQRYGKDASPRAKRSRFGFFTSRFWRDYELNLRIEIDRFGARPGYSLWYMGMDRPFPAKIARINKKHRINLVISHDIRHRSLDLAHNQRLLAEIAEGLWDEYFRQFARDARKFRRTIYYRFGYEMNGGWFPWGRKPDDFRAAWQRVYKLFADERAENVKWVFSPNVLWGDHQFDEHILAYYPGYEYVDIVGLDGYNFGDNFDDWHQWRSFDDLFGESLEGVAMFGKPIWIAEIGCAAGEGRIEWVYDMLDYLDRNPCIEAFFWFDDHKRGEPDFSIASDHEVLPAVRNWLGADSPEARDAGPLAALRNLLTFF